MLSFFDDLCSCLGLSPNSSKKKTKLDLKNSRPKAETKKHSIWHIGNTDESFNKKSQNNGKTTEYKEKRTKMTTSQGETESGVGLQSHDFSFADPVLESFSPGFDLLYSQKGEASLESIQHEYLSGNESRSIDSHKLTFFTFGNAFYDERPATQETNAE